MAFYGSATFEGDEETARLAESLRVYYLNTVKDTTATKSTAKAAAMRAINNKWRNEP